MHENVNELLSEMVSDGTTNKRGDSMEEYDVESFMLMCERKPDVLIDLASVVEDINPKCRLEAIDAATLFEDESEMAENVIDAIITYVLDAV